MHLRFRTNRSAGFGSTPHQTILQSLYVVEYKIGTSESKDVKVRVKALDTSYRKLLLSTTSRQSCSCNLQTTIPTKIRLSIHVDVVCRGRLVDRYLLRSLKRPFPSLHLIMRSDQPLSSTTTSFVLLLFFPIFSFLPAATSSLGGTNSLSLSCFFSLIFARCFCSFSS